MQKWYKEFLYIICLYSLNYNFFPICFISHIFTYSYIIFFSECLRVYDRHDETTSAWFSLCVVGHPHLDPIIRLWVRWYHMEASYKCSSQQVQLRHQATWTIQTHVGEWAFRWFQLWTSESSSCSLRHWNRDKLPPLYLNSWITGSIRNDCLVPPSLGVICYTYVTETLIV